MNTQEITVRGHIIDSLTLPKILDTIMDLEGTFEILDLKVGKRKTDPSIARLRVHAKSKRQLTSILAQIERLGACSTQLKEARLLKAPKAGVFPQGFYSTTNLETEIHHRGRWRKVQNIEMDCGIQVTPKTGRAICMPISRVKKNQWIVCGTEGVKVTPLERRREPEVFQFMGSAVSSEKPKTQLIHRLAERMRRMKHEKKKILVVAGPAVVHTGSAPYLERLIKHGYVDVLFAGNGLATHDIEAALFGTSLGVHLEQGTPTRDGHDHHMRAINTIRRLGGIRQAVRRKVLTRGIMHACIRRKIPFVLAGSIRDDGPLPEVITDSLEAQESMRRQVRGVGLALMLASTLHAIATGNLLPASVRTICVDINPAVVTKLTDRGSFQSVGVVSDTESFLRELVRALRL